MSSCFGRSYREILRNFMDNEFRNRYLLILFRFSNEVLLGNVNLFRA